VIAPPVDFCPAVVLPESNVPSNVPSLSPSASEKCNCQPGVVTFTFDFTLQCSDRNILTGDPGIEEAECLMFGESGMEPTDPFPVSIEQVSIVEVAQNLDTIKSTDINGTFLSGDTLTYETFAVTDTALVLNGQVPHGMIITLNGFNAGGEAITNSYVILFTNECGVYPVLSAGSTIGWTTLVSLIIIQTAC
jgi:hypothetical protein